MMDACVGKVLTRHLVAGAAPAVSVAEVTAQCELLSSLLRNEYLLRDNRNFEDSVAHRIQCVANQKEIIVKDGQIALSKAVAQQATKAQQTGSYSFAFVTFFDELCSHILDTYLCTLTALEGIVSGNMVVREEALVQNVHLAIMDLYSEGLITSLQSCLKTTIQTAIRRSAELGMIQVQTY